MLNLSNEEIVVLLRKEFDEDLFEYLVARFHPLFAKHYHRQRIADYDFDDYRQEGRLALIHSIEKYDNNKLNSFSNFFRIIYKNRIFNMYRKSVSESRGGNFYDLSLSHNIHRDQDESFTILESLEDPYQLSANKIVEIRDIKREFLMSLSLLEKAVFIYFYSSRSKEEIAQSLEVDYTQVQSALDRCRLKLRKLLAE